MEILKYFGGHLVAVRCSPELGGGGASRAFEPPFGRLLVVFSRLNMSHLDRLRKSKNLVEQTKIAG